MSGRMFVVMGIVECLQPDRGEWELIDSHGVGTVVCPFTTGTYILMNIDHHNQNNNDNDCDLMMTMQRRGF